MFENTIREKVDFLDNLLQKCDMSGNALSLAKSTLESLYGPKSDDKCLQWINAKNVEKTIYQFVYVATAKIVTEPLKEPWAMLNWHLVQWTELLKIENQLFSIISLKYGESARTYLAAAAEDALKTAQPENSGWIQNSLARFNSILKRITTSEHPQKVEEVTTVPAA